MKFELLTTMVLCAAMGLVGVVMVYLYIQLYMHFYDAVRALQLG
jgi:hypothetical protein